MPYTDEAVSYLAERIRQVQDFLGCRLQVENVSASIKADAPLPEAELIAAVSEEADRGLSLDLNNLYVNQINRR